MRTFSGFSSCAEAMPMPAANKMGGTTASARSKRAPMTIEGELVAKSTGTVSEFAAGDRVFHQKFGYGNVVRVDGNKLTIAFDKAGEKNAIDTYVRRA